MKQATKLLTFAMLACATAFCARAEITTGWLPTAAGTYTFTDSANWVNGDVNGVFSADWTPANATTIRFTGDWTGSLSFLGNIAKDVNFYGRKDDDSGAQNRSITLDDNILVRPSASSGKIVFDATVGFDLGGVERTFETYTPSTADKFRVSGPIKNGNLVLAGNGAGMTLVGDASASGDVTVMPNTTLALNWSTKAGTVRRAEAVKLERATLSANAYRATDVSEIVVLAVSGKDVPGVAVVTLSHNNNCLGTLKPDSLDIRDGGTLGVMADDLCAGAEATAGTRLMFVQAPTMIGDGGASGTPGASVIPGIVIGAGSKTPATGIQSGENYAGLFLATYDADFGVRKLSDSETATAASSEMAVNLVVNAGTPLALDGNAEVNSLQLLATGYRNDVPEISGDGTLTVNSGIVLMTVPKNGAKLNAAVDFGSAQGRFFSVGAPGEQAKIMKNVSGTGGVVFSKGLLTSFDTTVAPSSGARGFAISSSADYTGDTYVQCIVEAGSNDFFPHGARSGDTIVNGCLSFGTIAINGLYGTGAVRGATLTVGEGGSDSCFTGNGYLTSALNIAGGKFDLEGTIAQGAVNVASGAAIGGNGLIETTLTFADGAKFDVDVADDVVTCLNVAGAVTGGPVTVNANVTSGKWRTAQCVLRSNVAITATFNRGAGVGALELRNNGTELWASPKVSGFTIIIR